jgi:hypothetical protein
MSKPSGSDGIILKYQQNVQDCQSRIQLLKKTKRWIAIGRLTTALAGILLSWYFWPLAGAVTTTILLFTCILIFLIFRDTDLAASIAQLERLILVNLHELNSIRHSILGYENGIGYSDPGHAYASDLDLFGDFSLYQWMNRGHADQSKQLLAERLKNPIASFEIVNYQEAAKEMAAGIDISQQIQSTAMAYPLTKGTEKKLENWMSFSSGIYAAPFWKWFQNIYPIIPAAMVLLFAFGYLTPKGFLLLLVAMSILHYLAGTRISAEFEMLLNIEQEMDGLYRQLQLIENREYHSKTMHALQARLKPGKFPSATASIKNFNSILKKIGWRSNMLINALLQFFFFWDLRLKLLMSEWKKENSHFPGVWIRVIAETEYVVSLASVVRNNPDWAFPETDQKYFHFEGVQLGHPLISADKRVANDFSLEGSGKIALITGSNMAGKSTFLRTLGVNIILAQMGSAVCAGFMKMGAIKLMSSMRVADNLAENTSTFFAELKKLQIIIESVNRKEHVFVLLDEVLRGTNSTDRHRGSQALVRQLIQQDVSAVMATHDTELAQSESMVDESVQNYHFEGRIQDDELLFDYKIRKGICESLNATTLMKKIGIHFQD